MGEVEVGKGVVGSCLRRNDGLGGAGMMEGVLRGDDGVGGVVVM